MEKRFFTINTAVCDARRVQESTLAAYERIKIDTAVLLVSRETRPLLDRYPVELHAAHVLELEGESPVSSINGQMRLQPGQTPPAGQAVLMVNGNLDIAPGSEAVLKSYACIVVNGCVTCPESMVPLLTMVHINGAVEAYPDGCIRLKRRAVLDRSFHLRAKRDACYYAARQIVALAPDIRWDALAEKNVRFITRALLVAESQTEAALPLFDEQTDIKVLPDGCAYVDDDVVLDEALFRQYGGKLYINGNLTVNRDSAPWLEKFSFLHVNGDLLVVRDLAEAVKGIHAVYDRLRVVAGMLLADRNQVLIDRAMLEAARDGLSLCGCVKVTIREDVPAELIRDRLVSVEDCVSVVCTPEQRAAVELAARDVVSIGGAGCGEDRDVSAPSASGDDGNTKVVDAACYLL